MSKMLGLRRLLFGANTMQQNGDGAVTPISVINSTPVTEMLPITRFLGRQPILDAELNLYGYELLFRAGTVNSYAGDGLIGQEEATRLVIDNCLALIPEAGQGITFVNCTRDALMTGLATLLPPATTVLEILEDVEPDEELLQVCRDLKKKGYHFALDDFSPDGCGLAFLELASYVKVDFRASDAATRRQIYKMVAGSNVKLIGEKVETLSDIETARGEGCEFFQGYFFSKPIIVSSRLIPQSHLTYLQLISELSTVPSNLDRIDKLVMSEPALCYRLLRLVNSALYGLRTPVSTVRAALMVVGDDEVRKLVTVGMSGVFETGHSKSLVKVALERARFCELLAPMMKESAGKLYLLGMLSMIDALLQKPMTQIMELLPIPADMKQVLLGRQNSLSIVLNLIRCYESGEWQGCEDFHTALGLNATKSLSIYTQSVHWAERMLHHADDQSAVSLAS